MSTIVGMFDKRSDADAALEALTEAGFDRGRMSVAVKDHREQEEFSSKGVAVGDLGGEGATSGLISGAGVGIAVGLAIAGSTLILPGIGTLLIGGPLAAALTGAGIGAASGTLIGGLIGMGIPHDEAEHFSTGLEQGHVVLAVHAEADEAARVAKILDHAGSIRTHSA